MTSDHISESSDLFARGYNCAQVVFTAFARDNGIDPGLAMKMATGLGAGIGRTGNICGAVCGAILAIGLIHGMSSPDEAAAKEKCYALDQKFIRQFISKYNSIQCPDLLGYNMAIPAEREEARKMGVVNKICPDLVRGAVEILEEVLSEEKTS